MSGSTGSQRRTPNARIVLAYEGVLEIDVDWHYATFVSAFGFACAAVYFALAFGKSIDCPNHADENGTGRGPALCVFMG